jgi:hypothetical protein
MEEQTRYQQTLQDEVKAKIKWNDIKLAS